MAEQESVSESDQGQENRARAPLDRARRLYADARLLEDLCPNARGKEIARDVALLALDLMAEARGSV